MNELVGQLIQLNQNLRSRLKDSENSLRCARGVLRDVDDLAQSRNDTLLLSLLNDRRPDVSPLLRETSPTSSSTDSYELTSAIASLIGKLDNRGSGKDRRDASSAPTCLGAILQCIQEEIMDSNTNSSNRTCGTTLKRLNLGFHVPVELLQKWQYSFSKCKCKPSCECGFAECVADLSKIYGVWKRYIVSLESSYIQSGECIAKSSSESRGNEFEKLLLD